jgi:hypothetical protein
MFGLTPTRLAYLVIALVSGFALWSSPWAPAMLRGATASLVVGIGAVASWGRWRGRPADLWLVDIAVFWVRSHQVTSNLSWPRLLRRKTSDEPTSIDAADTSTTAA